MVQFGARLGAVTGVCIGQMAVELRQAPAFDLRVLMDCQLMGTMRRKMLHGIVSTFAALLPVRS